MNCPVCGQEYDQPVKFCPNCGVPQPDNAGQPTVQPYQPAEPVQPVQPVQPADPFAQPSGQAYIRQDYNPVQPAQNYTPPTYAAPAPGYSAYAGQPKPSATGQIVFSIINILCCGSGISAILGIIALIFAIMASSATSYEDAASKLKVAKILNIIGIVVVVLFFIIIIATGVLGMIFSGDYGYTFDSVYR